jgi:hypothetical protein
MNKLQATEEEIIRTTGRWWQCSVHYMSLHVDIHLANLMPNAHHSAIVQQLLICCVVCDFLPAEIGQSVEAKYRAFAKSIMYYEKRWFATWSESINSVAMQVGCSVHNLPYAKRPLCLLPDCLPACCRSSQPPDRVSSPFLPSAQHCYISMCNVPLRVLSLLRST